MNQCTMMQEKRIVCDKTKHLCWRNFVIYSLLQEISTTNISYHNLISWEVQLTDVYMLCWRIYLTKHTRVWHVYPYCISYMHIVSLSVIVNVCDPYYIVIGHVLSYHTWPGMLLEQGKCENINIFHPHYLVIWYLSNNE